MTSTQFLQTYLSLPDDLKKEAEHFVEFLTHKLKENGQKEERKTRGGYGVLKGKIKMSEDFDEPLDDFKEYM